MAVQLDFGQGVQDRALSWIGGRMRRGHLKIVALSFTNVAGQHPYRIAANAVNTPIITGWCSMYQLKDQRPSQAAGDSALGSG